MTDLSEWLLACIAEDEEAARAATPGPWRVEELGDSAYGEWWYIAADGLQFSYVAGSGYEGGGVSWEHDATHIARHDPARVLAECAAKRRIVELHRDQNPRGHGCPEIESDGSVYHDGWCRSGTGGCATLRLLALTYADREGYDERWRPEK